MQQNVNGALAVVLSSGFDPQKEPQPAGVLPAPEGAALTQSTLSGRLDFRAAPVMNASAYEGQKTTVDGVAPSRHAKALRAAAPL